MSNGNKHFAIATSTRADWGLLSPIAQGLRQRGAEVTVIATNMHLLPACGMTVAEIINDGFEPRRVPVPDTGKAADITASILSGFADELTRQRYDAIIILGDRYEMVGVAQAAVLSGVPVIHIAGGAVSEGAFDDCFRHAITKMAWLHLAETDEYARRIVQMGEDPERVLATGAIGVHNILHLPLMDRDQLQQSLGFDLDNNTLLITLHAATLSRLSFEEQYANLLNALDQFPDHKLLFTYPNNDVDNTAVITMLDEYAAAHRRRVHIVPSLGRLRYLSALQFVEAVVGNSSSGLVEVPSMGIPTLDIGCRQDGRTHGQSVVRCGDTATEIAAGLRRVLSPEMKEVAARRHNPYARPDTLPTMLDAILNANYTPYPKKKFHDL